MGQFFTITGLLWLLQNAFGLLTTLHFTGVTTNGSPTITNISSFVGLQVGQFIVGLGIPADATIVAINTGAGTITISANATATSTTGSPTDLWSYGTVGQGLTLYVHLLTGTVPANTNTPWSALTEASYDGYAPQAVTYPGVVNSPNGVQCCFSAECMTWAPIDYNVPNTITGIAWTYTTPGSSGPSLLAVEPFAVPVPLISPGQVARIIPVLSFNTNMLNTVASPVLP